MSAKTVALSETLGHVDLPAPLILEDSVPYGEALRILREAQRGSAIVCRGGKVCGIFTERDVLNRCVLEGVRAETTIRDLMTPNPRTVRAETTLGEAVELMHRHGVRNLPLVDGLSRPQGLVTVGGIIRYLADHYPAEVMNLPPVLHQVSHDTEGA